MKPRIYHVLRRLREPNPVIAFQDLWLLFKPGIDMYARMPEENFSTKILGSVVSRAIYVDSDDDLWDDRELTSASQLRVDSWTLSSNGKIIGRDMTKRRIRWYEGERQVSSLRALPLRTTAESAKN